MFIFYRLYRVVWHPSVVISRNLSHDIWRQTTRVFYRSIVSHFWIASLFICFVDWTFRIQYDGLLSSHPLIYSFYFFCLYVSLFIDLSPFYAAFHLALEETHRRLLLLLFLRHRPLLLLLFLLSFHLNSPASCLYFHSLSFAFFP